MIELIEGKHEQYPGIKVWVTKDLPPMVRISEVADTAKARDRLNRFMAGQTMPLIEGADVQDYIYLHDYDNFLYNERTGKRMADLMNDLIPPDEVYVPFQTAIDLDVLARDGVITNEHKYLLATAEREAAPKTHEALIWALAYLQQGVDFHDSDYYTTVEMAQAAITLAGGDKDGG